MQESSSTNETGLVQAAAVDSAGTANRTAPLQFDFPVIGVGASAGGLDSLEKLFLNMPPGTGAAFVIVQHLSPDFRSMMDEILARRTDMKVQLIEDGVSVRPGVIFLMGPDRDLELHNEQLRYLEKQMTKGVNLPIDRFFRSLAESRGPACAAIVCSGSGSDGSHGVVDICQAGGAVLVEDPETAAFEGMPRAAVNTGVVDVIDSVEKINGWVSRFIETFPSRETDSAETGDISQLGIDRVIRLLRNAIDIDFSQYKPNMIGRRIDRRLSLSHDRSIQEYIHRLENDPAELNQLYCDLMIGVTRFYRDEESFAALRENVLPSIIENCKNNSLRIWTPGCATGEEAYTLAIELHEAIQEAGSEIDVKIFATDAHRLSLDHAGVGAYTDDELSSMPATMVTKYFQNRRGKYYVNSEIRKMIVFASHNLLLDASFTNLDLVVCRNTLIYFKPEGQQRALSLMHFGLRPDGFLFLGPSETPGHVDVDYEVVNRRWRIYRKIGDTKKDLLDLKVPDKITLTDGAAEPIKPTVAGQTDRLMVAMVESVASEYLPPTFVTDSSFRLLYSTAGSSDYLRRQEGRFGGTLPDQLIPALRTTVLVGLQRCQREAESVEPVIVGTVAISGDELSVDSTILADSDPVETPADRSVRITIRRLQTPGKLMHGFCVTLDAQRPEEDRQARSSGVTPSVDDPIAAHLDTRARSVLEEELKYTKDSLHSTIEELETSNEELQATNEEMIASNEELQSTNEELHSVNEELYTVNSEHQRKIEELVELTDDMENLFLSSQDATIFLDSSGILRRITPRACEIFKLSELDAGRPLNHFRNPLKYKTLYEDIDALDPDGGPIESEVLDHDGNRYLLRLSPYRSSRGNSGTVLTLTSLQQLESARGQLEQREAMFRGTFENAAVGFAHVAMDGSWLRVNDRLCQLLGYTRDELLSLTFQSITHLDDLDSDLEQLERLKNGEIDSYSMEKRYVQKSGDALTTDLTVSLENDLNKGEPYFISIIQDATQRSNYQRELRAAISQRDQFLAVMSHELRNPLGALRNAVEYLKRTPAGGDRATEFLKVVDRQAVHVTRLVDDLLDTSRLTQNRITLQQELLNFCEVAGECIDAMRAVIESKPLGLSFSVNEPSLPIIGDRTRLLQIVENLLTNAKRYTPEGGSVQVSLKAAEGFAELTIADDGIGIAEENLDDIFNMFIRASDTRETQGGLGIGLALVKMLVDQHSGTISARSEGVGQGSAFTLRLPLVEYPQMEERNLPEERAKTKSVFQIVLVEDDEDARMTMHALLGLDGHEVSLAKDGVEGLELITATRPDFALVDLSMPLMNGTQVAKAVRADSSMDTVKLIALTGHGQPHDIKRTQEAGFDGHLTKPIDMNELAKTMNELSS